MFDSPSKLALGLVTGLVFGFLLQKGRAAKHEVIIGQLLFRNFTVVKIMGTAVAVGAVGVYALVAAGMTTIEVKPAAIGGVLLGAACFGTGLAVLGYCPGTTVAAAGEGKRDAFVGMAGMLAGAVLYVAMFPLIEAVRPRIANFGKVTWPELTATSPWPWVLGIAFVTVALYLYSRAHRAAGGVAQ